MATPEPRIPAPPVRLVIVDADRRVRDSLASLVASSDHVAVVGDAGQPGSALELLESAAPDVVIVDPRLPEVDIGLALIRTIRHRWPGAVVLAMGWSDELDLACRSAGAAGFVPKTDAPNAFVDAIVEAGERLPRSGGDGAGARRVGARGNSELAMGDSAARTGEPGTASQGGASGATSRISSILHEASGVAEGGTLPAVPPSSPPVAPVEPDRRQATP